VVAELEGSDAASVFFTSLLFCLAVLFNALLRGVEDHCDSGLLEAVIRSCTLCNVCGFLIFLSCQAEFPAGLLGSALILAVLEIGCALRIFLAGSPLSWAFFFNALLRVPKSYSSFNLLRTFTNTVVSSCTFSNIDCG